MKCRLFHRTTCTIFVAQPRWRAAVREDKAGDGLIAADL